MPQLSPWLSIESAPKDGREILIYGPGVMYKNGRTSMYAKGYHVGWWVSDVEYPFWATRDPDVTCRATHWTPIPSVIPREMSDTERLDWLDKATAEEHPHVPFFEEGKWRYPYLISNAGGFGGGVGHACFDTLREAIDAAVTEQDERPNDAG